MALTPLPKVAAAVSKAMRDDPVGGSVLVDEAVHTWLLEELDGVGDLVDKAVRAEALEQAAALKRSLGRAYVESVSKGEYPDGSATRIAGFIADLELVAKYETFTSSDGKQYQWYGRRAEDGRFARSVTARPRPLSGATQLSPNLPADLAPNGVFDSAAYNNRDQKVREALDAHQGEWEQASGFVQRMYRELGEDRDKVTVVVDTVGRDGGDAQRYTLPLRDGERGLATAQIADGFNPERERITRISVDAGAGASAPVHQQMRAFNAMGALFGKPDTQGRSPA